MQDPVDLLDEIHDNPAYVMGEIYMIRNIHTGMAYIGQTVTHRMNHSRYRPYGYIRRFKSHVSEALCDNKEKHAYRMLFGSTVLKALSHHS